MGLPARKIETRQASRRPRLTVVRPGTGTPKTKRGWQSGTKARNPRAAAALARQNFQMFCAIIIVVACLGTGRVWLSVEATKASLEANELRAQIKAERYEGDMLEVRQSSLGSPSRIRAIAGNAMDMAPASDVSYLNLTKPTAHRAPAPETRHASEAETVIAKLMRLTAGEAEVLLVGDVGLASVR